MPGGETFAITFLGTRDAAFGRGSYTSSQLVSLGDTDVLVDAGRGCVPQLARAGFEPGDLELVVLTHWHPDHVAGLPRLLRQASRLRVVGPPPPAWAALKTAAFRRVLSRLDVVEVGEELVHAGLALRSFATDHGTPSLGWRFSSDDGRVVLVPGDSRPTETLVTEATGVDLLVFEATFLDEHRDRAEASRHATAWEAGSLARAAECGTLALTHLSARYSRAEVEAEARLAFDRILVPRDLDRIELGVRDGEGPASATLVPHAP